MNNTHRLLAVLALLSLAANAPAGKNHDIDQTSAAIVDSHDDHGDHEEEGGHQDHDDHEEEDDHGDEFYGSNDTDNIFYGGAGNDTLKGFGGNDNGWERGKLQGGKQAGKASTDYYNGLRRLG